MELKIHTDNGVAIAELISENVKIASEQDALDVMAHADYQGARKIILHRKNIVDEFFDLKTRLAGDILQKFTNYQVDVAIIGDFENVSSKSLRYFIYESNKSTHVMFLANANDAVSRWSSKNLR